MATGEQENKSINGMRIGPKLKFYLFPLTRPTLKKRPYSKKIISIFSQELFFFNFIVNLENCPMKQCYLSKLFYFIVYSRTIQ